MKVLIFCHTKKLIKWPYLIYINSVHHMHEINHDHLMIAHQINVRLLIVNEHQRN